MNSDHAQTTNHVLMVRPHHFAMGSPTHFDNAFQEAAPPELQYEIAEKAKGEFDHYVHLLREAGINVTVVEDDPSVVTPDSAFPNNWFSTHGDGLLVTYPMFWPQRRIERREAIFELIDQKFRVNRTLDLAHWESAGRFLEGTGSLVLDRKNRVAYCCYSERATKQAIQDWCAAMDYAPITFHAVDQRGTPIYHTNVMLAIGTEVAVACFDSVADPAEKSKLTESLALSGRRLMGISQDQMDQFGGNMLELRREAGPLWVMSSAAFNSLDPAQVELLGSPLLHVPLPTIEQYGGGSARCMISEIFLAPK
ncbi:citrulline utilization hydrolase CtlX [Lewinella sp. 4G2]|uniref:citrulline utilization hydrolase CtlX n=1 Tax=Lewinella sp. 4G2 TaxID=1803372 RepID=UPI0007B48C5F|nr:arginine deiminase-related protein [Lewinella sp. 4G2]OAV45640.1 hypothetical protein A3850_014560 [Lewinella sp. 4G2]